MAASEPVDLTHEEETALGTITEGTNKFAVSLYRALASKQTGNVFFSPLSVQMVLALAYTGAKGETAQELAALLGLPEKIEDTYAGYQSLIKVLQAPVLKLANRMFVEKTAGVKEGFQNNAEKYFHSPAEALDFRSAYDKSREQINSWVENQTNKKITNLLQPGTITSDTRLVLVNAIHFKADWMSKFREEDTKEKPFHVSKAKTVQVNMMHVKKKFCFAHDKELQAKMLQLEYEDENFYMTVILPDDIEGLPALEAKLEKVNLSERIRRMKMSTVKVALPKFKMEETMKLNEILESLGAKAMFEVGKADFSGLSDQRLVVSEVIHKAFIEVNEKGTEAAAATAMGMYHCLTIGLPPPRDEVFIADHPFVFFITSRFHESALFFGRYKTPYL